MKISETEVSITEMAKRIRVKLKSEMPGYKFSVRCMGVYDIWFTLIKAPHDLLCLNESKSAKIRTPETEKALFSAGRFAFQINNNKYVLSGGLEHFR